MAKIFNMTLIYISASQMPQRWMDFHLLKLREAVDNTPIISITRKPLDLGKNLIDTEPQSYWNIYMQLLRGTYEAETEYVAMVEDDTLYSREHFLEFRPKPDEVSYNRSRWSLFTWDPMYCLRQRVSNCSLIAPRELLIDALEERKQKWPNDPPSNRITGEVGRAKVEMWLKVSPRKSVEWWSTCPIIQLNHPSGSDDTQRARWKKHGQLKAHDIPYWSKARDIAEEYNECAEDNP